MCSATCINGPVDDKMLLSEGPFTMWLGLLRLTLTSVFSSAFANLYLCGRRTLPLTLTDTHSHRQRLPPHPARPINCSSGRPVDKRVGLVFLSHRSFTAVRQRLRHCVCCSWVWEARGHRSVQTLINTLTTCNRESERGKQWMAAQST